MFRCGMGRFGRCRLDVTQETMMGWAKLDDARAMNRKLREAGFAARGLDEAAICQISADLTDGHISRTTVEMLAAAHGEKKWQKLVASLVEVGRWEPNGDGWYVHDYLEFNPSKAEWQAERDKKRAAGQQGGRAKAIADALARATAPVTASVLPNVVAVPSPSRPDPLISPGFTDTKESCGQPKGGTGAQRPEETNQADRQLALTKAVAALCTGRDRSVVSLEAAGVILWAYKLVDPKIIEEAIGWWEQQEKPPELPRAVASVIAKKAADRGIGLKAYVPTVRGRPV